MTGSDSVGGSVGPTAWIRTLPSRLRRLIGVDQRLADVEARLAAVEERLRSPELDGRALHAVRDSVRDIAVQVAEELDTLSDDRARRPSVGSGETSDAPAADVTDS